jgi:uncharacterized protein (UPF0297 family)
MENEKFIAGVDFGYGFTKIYARNSSGDIFKLRIPSIVAPADHNFETFSSHLQRVKFHEGKKNWQPTYLDFFEMSYFSDLSMPFNEFSVGIPGKDGRSIQSQQLTDWNFSQRKMLFYGVAAFLATLAKGADIYLCTGLPNEIYTNLENLKAYKDHFDSLNNFIVYRYNFKNPSSPIKEVIPQKVKSHEVMAQSDGSFIIEKGLPKDFDYMLLTDIGWGTINLTLLSGDENTLNVYDTEWKGIGNYLVENIQNRIRTESGGSIPINRIIGMLEGTSPRSVPKLDSSSNTSRPFDVSNIVQEEIEAYGMLIKETIERFIQQQKVAPYIFLTGGGSQLVKQFVKKAYGDSVYVTSEPIFGNAKGFFYNAYSTAEEDETNIGLE